MKQDATYIKHVYHHSEQYAGVGSCFKGKDENDVAEARTHPEMWLFDHGFVIL